MRVLDLFSGLGGFSLGLERAGMETAAFVEIDPFCRKLLAQHWPGVPIYDDIKTIAYAAGGQPWKSCPGNGREGAERGGKEITRANIAPVVGPIDLVCGGFPCQPFSQAGQRRGSDDDRHLWPEMLRVIREVQPTWVIGENVIGLETMGLEHCVSDLEGDGFAVQVFDIPACGVGAPHRRHRLWIVAYSERNAGRRNGQGWGSLRRNTEPSRNGAEGPDLHPNGNSEPARSVNGEMAELQSSPDANAERLPQSEPQPETERTKSRTVKRTRATGENGRDAESRVRRGDDGLSFRMDGISPVTSERIPDRVARLKALGNAVVPQIPEMIGRAILSQ